MITKDNLEQVLDAIGFQQNALGIYEKSYSVFDCRIAVDIQHGTIQYPEEHGMKIERHTTDNFKAPENFVELECIDRLLRKGYRPEDIELERKWSLGHTTAGGEGSGFADICVFRPRSEDTEERDGETRHPLFIIDCKTAGKAYKKEYNNMLSHGGQLFSYWWQEHSCKYLVLYASDFVDGNITYTTDSVDCSDDKNLLAMAEKAKKSRKEDALRLYRDAKSKEELYTCWVETYDRRFCGDVIFRDDSVAYEIGAKPLRKRDLDDFSKNDKVVNRFEEILRHNNVSDKENAFNRLVALFICKLVDEMQKQEDDVVDFQYQVGTDTYETLQDRLQRLHKDGMEKFMREEIFYVPDTYAEKVVQQYTGAQRNQLIEELKKTLRILKFYTNNDFAFKDVHNEELFYQNGKIVVEVVQLFQGYRIIGSSDLQTLGDLFEQLLNKGFKQNEGQFFTPVPITRFIWDSLPLRTFIQKDGRIEYPKIIDYACGAGHFLTQGIEAIRAFLAEDTEKNGDEAWVSDHVYGVEKDYRLARVSKISLFMHGAGGANVIFGDGLENYREKGITPGTFDILVANPPYAVKSFKSHLKLHDNDFRLLDAISNDGGEIETLFVERIAQLLKPGGLAAVILPSSILSNDSSSYNGAREELLSHFYLRAITCFGSKTFGATGTNTVVLFLQKIENPPVRFRLVADSADAILSGQPLTNWEDENIFTQYLAQVECDEEDYRKFLAESASYTDFAETPYLQNYVDAFENLAEIKNKRRQKAFQNMKIEDQSKWLDQHFYALVKKREREKLCYFAMVYQQTVLVITAPAENAKQKVFLGYDWSNRKGNEGIVIKKEGGMLYDPADRLATNTLAGMVRGIFEHTKRPAERKMDYCKLLPLKDMIDFAHFEFHKAIRTVDIKKIKITSRFPLQKLTSMCELNPSRSEISDKDDALQVTFIEMSSLSNDGHILKKETKSLGEMRQGGYSYFGENDIIIAKITPCMENGKCAIAKDLTNHIGFGSTEYHVFHINSEKVLPEYLFAVLNQPVIRNGAIASMTGASGHRRVPQAYYEGLMIPVPPRDIQKEIIDELAELDDEFLSTRMSIVDYRSRIEKLFQEFDVIGGMTIKLGATDKFALAIGKRVLSSELLPAGVPVYSANVQEPFGYIGTPFFEDYDVGSILWGIDGDWDVRYLPPQTPFYPTDHCGTLRVQTTEVNARYLAFALRAEGKRQRFTRTNRPSLDRVRALRLELPPKHQQDAFVNEVERMESEIETLEEKRKTLEEKKQGVLKKYLL